MKKIRIEIKDDRYKCYDLFDTVEALYVWLSEGIGLDRFIAENEDCITPVELDEDGQWLEIEWMGAEYTPRHVLHYVRIARATPKADGVGFSLGIYAGWIHGSQLKFADSEDENTVTRRIDSESQINMDEIFKPTPSL